MKNTEIKKIFERLMQENYKVMGPEKQDEEICILELNEAPASEMLEKISDRPFKYHFLPIRETLYQYNKNKLQVPINNHQKKALFGMSSFDLKALELYRRVFEDDIYFKNHIENLLIVGFSAKPFKNHKTIFFEMGSDFLNHVFFDIFIEKNKDSYKFYSGTKNGERILKDCNIKNKKIVYSIKKEDKAVLKLKKAMERAENNKIWEELGRICLACGKCTVACPTCFCFDLESKIGPEKQVERTSGNCFFDDFTRIAGGHKFLNTPAEKIKFWYYHKFVRIPRDYGLPGCVDCGRCTKVCPVGIDIHKNIKRLIKGGEKKK